MTFYRGAVPPGEVLEFATSPLDHVGVPAWSVLWSGHGSFHGGLGYGIDDDAALLSAWGELTEAVLLVEAAESLPVRRASYAAMREAMGDAGVVGPRPLVLEAVLDGDADRLLDKTRLRR